MVRHRPSAPSPEIDPVCEQMRDLLRGDEARIYVELPGAALNLSRSFQSEAVRACSAELLVWIQRTTDARPLDALPLLEPRIATLGALSSHTWNEEAAQTLLRLLEVEPGGVKLHYEVRSLVPGPGSKAVPLGPVAVVSLADLRAWAATALVRARLNRRVEGAYVDFLVGYFARHLPNPVPVREREPATNLLLIELIRAFELAPNDPRWERLPSHLRQAITR